MKKARTYISEFWRVLTASFLFPDLIESDPSRIHLILHAGEDPLGDVGIQKIEQHTHEIPEFEIDLGVRRVCCCSLYTIQSRLGKLAFLLIENFVHRNELQVFVIGQVIKQRL